MKSQDDHPSHEIPHESRANFRVPARLCDVEGGAAVCSKNSTLGFSMEPRGPLACGLLPQLWLLIKTNICCDTCFIDIGVAMAT